MATSSHYPPPSQPRTGEKNIRNFFAKSYDGAICIVWLVHIDWFIFHTTCGTNEARRGSTSSVQPSASPERTTLLSPECESINLCSRARRRGYWAPPFDDWTCAVIPPGHNIPQVRGHLYKLKGNIWALVQFGSYSTNTLACMSNYHQLKIRPFSRVVTFQAATKQTLKDGRFLDSNHSYGTQDLQARRSGHSPFVKLIWIYFKKQRS